MNPIMVTGYPAGRPPYLKSSVASSPRMLR